MFGGAIRELVKFFLRFGRFKVLLEVINQQAR